MITYLTGPDAGQRPLPILKGKTAKSLPQTREPGGYEDPMFHPAFPRGHSIKSYKQRRPRLQYLLSSKRRRPQTLVSATKSYAVILLNLLQHLGALKAYPLCVGLALTRAASMQPQSKYRLITFPIEGDEMEGPLSCRCVCYLTKPGLTKPGLTRCLCMPIGMREFEQHNECRSIAQCQQETIRVR